MDPSPEEQVLLSQGQADAVFDVLVEELGCPESLRADFQGVAAVHGLRSFQFNGWPHMAESPCFTLRGRTLTVDETDLVRPFRDRITWANIFIESRLRELRELGLGMLGPRSRLSALASGGAQ